MLIRALFVSAMLVFSQEAFAKKLTEQDFDFAMRLVSNNFEPETYECVSRLIYATFGNKEVLLLMRKKMQDLEIAYGGFMNIADSYINHCRAVTTAKKQEAIAIAMLTGFMFVWNIEPNFASKKSR